MGIGDSLGSRSMVLADDGIDSAVLSEGTATYQHGLGLLSEVRGGSTRFYHADALGTTRDLSNASGAASASLETDAFGNAVSSSGTGTPFGFAGQHGYQTDPDTGWQRLGHRFYLPGLGRFLSRDPIRAGYNWYSYCGNDPVNAVDPSGLDFSLAPGVFFRGFSPKEEKKIKDAIKKIRKTEPGKDILQKVIDRAKQGDDVYIDRGKIPRSLNPPINVVYINPDFDKRVRTDKGMELFDIERQLAHELGHLGLNEGDQDNAHTDDFMNMVEAAENPIAMALRRGKRLDYGYY